MTDLFDLNVAFVRCGAPFGCWLLALVPWLWSDQDGLEPERATGHDTYRGSISSTSARRETSPVSAVSPRRPTAKSQEPTANSQSLPQRLHGQRGIAEAFV